MKQNKEEIIIESGAMEMYLGQHGQTLLNKTFPVKVGYWLARIYDKLRRELKIYARKKNELINKYVDEEKSKNLPPGQFNIKKDDRDIFSEKIQELSTTKIPLGINKIFIKQEDLPQLSIREMELLLPFLEIEGFDND